MRAPTGGQERAGSDHEVVGGHWQSTDRASAVQAPTASLPLRSRGLMQTFDYAALNDPDLADNARAAAERIRVRLRDNIIDIGRDLIAVKEKMLHGAFVAWIRAELDFSDRTAERYMGAARLAAGKFDIVSILPSGSVYLLAAPSAPPSIVTQILDAAEAGNVMPTKEIRTKLADAIKAERRAKIEAAKSPEQLKKERKAVIRRGKLTP